MSQSVKEIWGMACPKCGDDRRIDIYANIWVHLFVDGTGPHEATNRDHHWEPESEAVCNGCDHQGTVATFTKAGGKP